MLVLLTGALTAKVRPPGSSTTSTPGSSYTVYCRDYDVEVKSDRLDDILGASESSTQANAFDEINTALAAWRVRNDLAALEAASRIRAAVPEATLKDTVVSLLVDHSGSMRGQKMLLAAGAITVASDLLDGLKTKQEVLGFTTVRWQGGHSRKKWLREGHPPNPGRLNDLLHIVYNGADERPNQRRYATMLRLDLLKENIDGEAIEWAASRLSERAESNKHLIVISDGASVDDSTLQANRGDYLEAHLIAVIRAIERAGDIQLAAVGINHDVGRYYRHSATVNTPDDLGRALLGLIERRLLRQRPELEPTAAPAD